MNKNTVMAFAMILLSIWFFQSPLYYEKILKKEHPSKTQERMREVAKAAREKEPIEEPRTNTVTESKKDVIAQSVDSERSKGTAGGALSDSIPEVVENVDTIWIETNTLVCGISEGGGRIISVKTKDYRYGSNKDSGYIELVGDTDIGGAGLKIGETNYDNMSFEYVGGNGTVEVGKGEEERLVFELRDEKERSLKKVFTFSGEGYKIGYDVVAPWLIDRRVTVSWLGGISESEAAGGGRSAQYDVRKMHLFDGSDVEHLAMKKAEREDRTGYYKWIGLTSKYFLISLVSNEVKDADVSIQAIDLPQEIIDGKKKGPKLFNYAFSSRRTATEEIERYWLYLGPSKLNNLKEHDIQLQKVLFAGWSWFFWADKWFPALCEFVLWLLIVLQGVVKDYGIVIILLTVISRMVTYPLTQSSMKSMNRMKEIQPKVTALREKYKNNPKKMNEKMMAMYKKEGVNPLNPGCLPMFLQMPILFSLFIVLRKAIELRGQGTFLVPWIKDLSQPEVLFTLPGGINLPFYGSNVALLPIVMAVLTFFQNKATIKDPNQKAMIYFMPIFMLVLFNSFPSGLVLYWTFSSALQLVQQFFMERAKKQTATI